MWTARVWTATPTRSVRQVLLALETWPLTPIATCVQYFISLVNFSLCFENLTFCLAVLDLVCVLANPCQNGATCAEVDGIDVDCTCAEGYTGSVCETGMIFMRFLCNVRNLWKLSYCLVVSQRTILAYSDGVTCCVFAFRFGLHFKQPMLEQWHLRRSWRK